MNMKIYNQDTPEAIESLDKLEQQEQMTALCCKNVERTAKKLRAMDKLGIKVEWVIEPSEPIDLTAIFNREAATVAVLDKLCNKQNGSL